MAWVVQRQTKDDNTIFEVFVYKSNLREEYGHRYVPASAVADTLDSESKIIHCSGYELVEICHTNPPYTDEAYIFYCTCDEPCYTSTIKMYADDWINRLRREYYYN